MKRLCLLIVLVLTALSGVTDSTATGAANRPLPTKDPFYRYSGHKSLAKIPRGTVLKKRVVQVSLSSSPTPISADQLLYRTTDQAGHPAVTVTTVLQPSPATSVAPRIVAYLSFYDALGSQCDPSYTLPGGDPGADNQQQTQVEEDLISAYFSQGYVITVPDFEGTHLHWAAGQESGKSALDSIKATESDLGVGPATPVALTGYSGGSIAAEWGSELAHHYAPKLNIVGVAEGGIPVDMAHNLHYINGSKDWSGVIPAVLVSLSRAFGIHTKHYLSAKGRRITHTVRHQCIGSFNGNYPGLTVQSLMKHRYRHFLRVPAFARVVNKLLMGSTKGHPKGPLFMGVGNADGTGDNVMVAKDVEALAHEYCKQHVPVQLEIYDGSTHSDAALHFEPKALTFLQQRFDGTPFDNGCSSIGKGNSLKPLPVHHKSHHKKHR